LWTLLVVAAVLAPMHGIQAAAPLSGETGEVAAAAATVKLDFVTKLVNVTTPVNLQLSVGSTTQIAPFSINATPGASLVLNAPVQQYAGGKVYDFVSWSDGGLPQHTIVAPAAPLTYTAVYTQQKAAPNGSLFFDGKDDIVRTKNLPRLTTYTFEVWFKPVARSTQDQVIMSDGNWLYSEAMFTLLLNARKFVCSGIAGEIVFHAAGAQPQCSGVIAQVGKWHHVAVTRDNVGNRRIFVNGTLVKTNPLTALPPDSNGKFTFGRAGDAIGSYFNGYIDEARISNTAMYSGNFSPSTQSLPETGNTVALWHFNEGQGQFTEDVSINYNGGVLGNSLAPDLADPLWLSESPIAPPVQTGGIERTAIPYEELPIEVLFLPGIE
jgi:hypothetical protein